ncbi:MAG: LCP family protein [Anaerolineae bacterium]|nr:LCP family protein [Anaerolineae bacterium]
MQVPRWMRVFEWLIFVGLMVLVVVGARAWANNAPRMVIATWAPSPTPSTTPTSVPEVAVIPPTWTPTPAWTPSPAPTATPDPTPMPTPTLTQTPTFTPVPGPIYLPTSAPILEGTPMTPQPLPQPTPMPHIPQPAGTINILALGMDRTDGESYARTDVMMIVSIFPDVPSVSLTSIPRDYYAWIPTWGLDKLNTAWVRGARTQYPGGGASLLKATIEYNFGIPIHFYALVDFDSYRTIVDAIGGVDIVVECPFHDTYPDPESETGQTDIDLEPGLHHLSGKYALWYVRSRWNTSDFDRHRRQQQVLRAIMVQALNQNLIPRIPDLWGVYQDSVETELSLTDVLYLGSVGARLDMRDIKSRFIRGSSLLTSWTAPNGGYVLVPNYEALYEFMQEAVQPPVSSRATQRAYRVLIQNGSGNRGWGEIAAYRLALEGFEVVAIEDVPGVARTTVTDFTTTSKGSPLYKLRSLYKLQTGDVIAEPIEGIDLDFRVTLGWNYNPCDGTTTAYWRPTPTPTPTPPGE